MQQLGWISRHYSEWKKISKGYILYYSIYMTVSKRQNCSDTERISVQEMGSGRVWLQRGSMREFSEVMDLFCTLIVVVGTWIPTYTEMHSTVYTHTYTYTHRWILLHENIFYFILLIYLSILAVSGLSCIREDSHCGIRDLLLWHASLAVPWHVGS